MYKNLAEKNNNFKEIDKELAFMIFLIEKEFSFPIYHDFPAMKFYNLTDKYNNETYTWNVTNKGNGGKGVKTFG